MANLIQIKRGLDSSLPIGNAGEPLFTTDTKDFYIGDGTTNQKFQKDLGYVPVSLTRFLTTENFASPNGGGYFSGQYYDTSFHGDAATTRRFSANNDLELVPFFTNESLTINQLGVAISGNQSGNGTVAIYTSDANGWPSVKVFETASINMAVTGYTAATVSFTFTPGVIYWFGVYASARPTFRCVNISSSVNLGINGNNGTSYFIYLRYTGQSSPLPATLTAPTAANRTAGAPISVRFRVA